MGGDAQAEEPKPDNAGDRQEVWAAPREEVQEAAAQQPTSTDTSGIKPESSKEPKPSIFFMMGPREVGLWWLGFVGAFLGGCRYPALAILVGGIFDDLGETATMGDPEAMGKLVTKIRPALIHMGIIAGATSVVKALTEVCFATLQYKMTSKFQRVFFETLLRKNSGWYDERGPTVLLSVMKSSVASVQDLFAPDLPNCITGLSAFVLSLVVAMVRSWQLGLIMLCVLPFLMIMMAMGMAAFMKMMQAASLIGGSGGLLFEQGIWGIRTVAAYGLEDRIVEHCQPWHDMLGKVCTPMTWFGSTWFSNRMAFEWFGAALTYFVGSRFVLSGEMNHSTGKQWMPGDIFSVWFVIYMGMQQLQLCTTYFQSFAEGRGAYQALLKYRTSGEEDIEGKAVDDAKSDQAAAPLSEISTIEFQNVSFRYPSRPEVLVLDNVSFELKKGQRVAVVGESGSGKSTIVGLIERFYNPLQGRILVNGRDIREIPLGDLRGAMALVEQEPVLFAASLRKNLDYGSKDGEGIPQGQIDDMGRRCSMDFVQNLPEKYETFAGTKGRAFSGGERQRVCIARALLRKPQLLLLDEATSALDNKSEKDIQRTLDVVVTEAGTSITVAHRLSTIKGADLILSFKDGKVVERGSHSELMALGSSGMYYGMVKLQEIAEQDEGGQTGTSAPEVEKPSEQETKNAVHRMSVNTPAELGLRKGEVLDTSRITPRNAWHVILNLNKLIWECRRRDSFFLGLQVLGFIGLAGTQAPFAFVLIDMMTSLYSPDIDEVDAAAKLSSLKLCLLGLVMWFSCQMRIGLGSHGQWSFFGIVRSKMVKNLMYQDVGYFDNAECSPAKIILNYAGLMQQGFGLVTNVQAQLIQAVVCVAITLSLALSMQATVAGVVLAVWPVTLVSKYMEFQDLIKKFKRGMSTGDEAASAEIFHNSILFLKTVRSLQCEKKMVQEFNDLTAQEGFKNFRVAMRTVVIKSISGGCEMGLFAFAFWWSTKQMEQGAPFRNCMIAQMCILLGLMPITNIMAIFDQWPNKIEAGARILDFVNAKPTIHTGAQLAKEPFKMANTRLKFDAVEFKYKQRPEVEVLRSVSFEVPLDQGKMIGLCGPSGSGKSSILSLMMRFYDPTGGSISVEGLGPLGELDVRRWRRTIGYVQQEPTLFQDTVLNNVRYGNPDASPEDVTRIAKMAHLNFISGEPDFKTGDELKMPDALLPGERRDFTKKKTAEEKAKQSLLLGGAEAPSVSDGKRVAWSDPVRDSTLSGGQKQRIAMARALLRDPPILVFDEATSALDSFSEKVSLDSIASYRKEKTQFLVAHRLSTIADADLIMVVSMGVIVEMGTSEELLEKKGLYHNLVQNQSMTTENASVEEA